jgi:hypothetical protein
MTDNWPLMNEDDPSSSDAATAGTPAALPAADSSFDLSLRFLTGLVMVALAASVSLLVYRWIAPRLEAGNAGPIPASANHPTPAAAAPDQAPPHRDEVLMDPGRVFKCEEQGRVTFSDQACNGTGSAARAPAGAGAAPAAPAPTGR